MGSGKSTIGKILSEKLGFLFIDIDKIIEIYEGCTITDIFKNKGEDYFRTLESEIIKKIYSNSCCVFSCGGGVVLKEQNMAIIKNNSIVVYLSVSADTAYNRLKDLKDRPLIEKNNKKETIENILKKRVPLYLKYADMVFDVNNVLPDKIAEKIIETLKKQYVII